MCVLFGENCAFYEECEKSALGLLIKVLSCVFDKQTAGVDTACADSNS